MSDVITDSGLARGAGAAAGAAAHAAGVRALLDTLRSEIGRVFVGQGELVDLVLHGLLADGHVLIEGVPGLGKTLLVRTLAEALGLSFSRVQFTPDLMPADITGTTVLAEKADGSGGHELKFQAGPIVANIVLADEINRATPKTQSALLEAMQERQVTAAGRTIRLPEPFLVLATQNPVEQEGTYPLPEAQLDRFMVKALVGYPSEQEYHEILDRTTSTSDARVGEARAGIGIVEARRVVREVAVSRQVQAYAIRVVMATQPGSAYAPEDVRRYVAYGAGPRAAQSLLLMAKVRAIAAGRFAVSCQDVRDVSLPVLRHRLVLNFAGLSGRVTPDALAGAAVAAVPELSGAAEAKS